ncbi:MAG: S-layer homology domain-containing protein [Clostridiales bacterium]|nr:S-layer homology domain-containing protein [Clostridiales bacterium]
MKIKAFIITMLLAFGFAVTAGAADYKAVVGSVTEIEIVDDSQLEEEVSRGEFAKILYNIQYGDTPAVAEGIFKDVTKHHYASGYVANLYIRKVVLGNENMEFRPDDSITVSEAYTMLLRLAGYGAIYSDIYGDKTITYAGKVNLSNGITKSGNEFVTYNDAYRMVYNLLDVKVVKVEWNSGKDATYTYGNKFMEEVLETFKFNGVIKAVGEYSLTNDKAAKGFVKVNDISYADGFGIDEDWLGYGGDVYYKDGYDNGLEIVGFVPETTTEKIITFEDQPEYDDYVYKYYNKDGKEVKLRTSADRDVLYNRHPADKSSQLIPNYGTIKLIDNNDDGKYEVVIVEDIISVCVKSVNSRENVIAYRKASQTEPMGYEVKNVDLDSYDEARIYNSEGYETDIDSLKEGMIISITDCGDEIIIRASEETKSGVVSQIETENSLKYIVVDNEKMLMNPDCYYDNYYGGANVAVTLCFDYQGTVALIKLGSDDSTTEWKFGYLLKAYVGDDGDEGYVKLLTEAGRIEKFKISTGKCIMDNTKTAAKDAVEILKTNINEVIRYYVNSDGEIKSIDTAQLKSAYDLTKSYEAKENDSLLKRAERKLYYKPADMIFHRLPTQNDDVVGEGELAGQTFIGSNTIVFRARKSDDPWEVFDDKYYRVDTASNIKLETEMYIKAYNTGSDSMMADVVVIYVEKNNSLTENSRAMLISNVSEALDEDGDISTYVTGLYRGGEKSFYFEDNDDAYYTDDGIKTKIKRGDVIRIETDGDYIVGADVIYNGGDSFTQGRTGVSGGEGLHFNSIMRYVYGYADYIADGKLSFVYDGNYEFFQLGNVPVYIYDTEEDKAYIGTVADLKDKQHYDDYDNFILGTHRSVVNEIIFIKK